MRKRGSTSALISASEIKASYKLVDLGTAIAVGDEEIEAASQSLRTISEIEVGGTHSLVSGKMKQDVQCCIYPRETEAKVRLYKGKRGYSE